MNKKRWFGVLTSAIGLNLTFSKQIFDLTGLVISSGITESSSWLQFAGISMFFAGAGIFLSGGLEDRVQSSSIELKRLGAVYKYMEKKGLPGTYSPETLGRPVNTREVYGLLKDTKNYIHEHFPNTETEVVIAGSISRAKGGRRTAIKEHGQKNLECLKNRSILRKKEFLLICII